MVRSRISAPASLGPLLAVGGLDPSGCAGVLADARVFESFGLPYRVALSSITAQSEKKFFGWEPVSPRLFRAQLEAAGTRLQGVKIGMLGTPAHARILLRWLEKNRPRFIVWDPVLRSSTGALLFRGSSKNSVLGDLWEISDAVTPNLSEAEWLSGRKIENMEMAREAVEVLFSRGKDPKRFLVLKGGHLPDKKQAIDLVRYLGGSTLLPSPRRSGSRRGSGCTFASALLVGLCQGKDPVAAARLAKREVLKRLFDQSTPQRLDSKLSKRN